MTEKPALRTEDEIRLVRELADILNEADLSEIRMSRNDLKIHITKHSSQVVQAGLAPASVTAPAPEAASAQFTPTEAVQDPGVTDHPGTVTSPMVGTAYTRPSPDADPFVREGDSVNAGDTIILIEAMKTYNPIVAVKPGTITKILVENAQPVEFGEALFILE
ncbi:MAG: acetyl-CoA carboxylase biotin carboxyl carrier protein [Hyphomonadaceae bacterium]|nr:acetyl-CoA carboxylase biotin carboxyl carrier protein [Hyphomonadaceae bacterium]MBC6412122.1 acetyl-CoA carboxylase biotin carboxyl carrier protein [Hyphomonadaceae bacterium]